MSDQLSEIRASNCLTHGEQFLLRLVDVLGAKIERLQAAQAKVERLEAELVETDKILAAEVENVRIGEAAEKRLKAEVESLQPQHHYMREYHKIQSVYKRDERGCFIDGEWAKPWMKELDGIAWMFTEKVDGTNIRVQFISDPEPVVRFGGRTDKAQISTKLLVVLQDLFPVELFVEAFPGCDEVVLFGEGYGAGVQKGGIYRPTPNFILFDVMVGPWLLEWDNVKDVAEKMGLRIVPVVGGGSLRDAIAAAKCGYSSHVAEQAVSDLPAAEGIVCRPAVDLFDRKGDRVIVKVKHKDFR